MIWSAVLTGLGLWLPPAREAEAYTSWTNVNQRFPGSERQLGRILGNWAVGDPLNEARCEYIEKHGGNAFMHYSLPTAVIRFRQGFGRLIRHRHDRGVVVVADRRIVAKRYGQHFQNSVPCKTEEIPDRDKFLRLLREFLPAPGGPGQEAAPGKQPGQGEPPAPARDQERMQFEREKLD